MAGALRKTMVYLGLAPEDDEYDYDEYDETDERERPRGREDERRHVREVREVREVEDDVPAPVRRVERVERLDRPERSGGAHVAGVPSGDDEPDERPHRAEVTPLPRRTPVREVIDDVEVTGVHRITTIHPRTYNEATNIGESFREGTPVIMNLSDLDDADAKRLVDFAAGLVFGLQGSFERVTNKVFLLSPRDVEVTSERGEPTKASRAVFNQS